MRKTGHQGIIEIGIMLDLFTHDYLRIVKTSPSNFIKIVSIKRSATISPLRKADLIIL